MTGRAAACCQPLVQLQQPLVGQHRAGHAAAPRPARPHRLRGHASGPAASAASTDLVVGRSTAAVTVRVARSTMPVSSARPGNAVIQQHHARRTGWSRSPPLARAASGAPAEGTPGTVGQRLAGPGRAGRVQARGDPLEQPVERGPGRHRDRGRPVPFCQDLPGPPQVEAGRPGRPACLLADRLLQRLHHTLVGAAPGRPGPAGTPVHQPGQAAGLIPLPLTFHRPGS